MSRPVMKTIPVSQAVGTVLCHDITRIEVGGEKGPVFRKGHIVREEDIPVLLSVGKENLYVFEKLPGMLHENEAATRIGNLVAGSHLTFSEIKEGRVNFLSDIQGLLRVDVSALTKVNSFDEITLSTLHTMQEVRKGQAVGGTRIIPLMIEEEKIVRLENAVSSPVLEVLPFRSFRVGVVTTGSEVYYGRIKDAFGPVLRDKFESKGSVILEQIFTNDSEEMISESILSLINKGADMIVCTGGMSVDPDDRTPSAIRKAGAKILSYGAPAYPGAMFLLSYLGDIPVLGLPGCVMYHKASIFELIIPRILAGIRVTRDDIVALGHGGFCEGCKACRYPSCAFGKF